jgi:cyclin-dependent kinase 7
MGTIFVELVLRVPFLAGDTDMDQLKKTFHAMGSPTEEEWPVRLYFYSPASLRRAQAG